MPKLEIYQSQANPGSSVSVRTVPNDIGNQVSNLGGAVSRTAAFFIKKEEDDDRAKAAMLIARARKEITEGFINEQLNGDPKDFTERMKALSTETLKAYREELTTESGKQVFDVRGNELNYDTQIKSIQHEASARAQARVLSMEQGINDNAASLQNDPTQLDPVLRQTLEDIQTLPIDQNAKNKLAEQTQQVLSKNAVLGLISLDPELAAKKLDNGDYDELLAAGDKKSLRNYADSAKRAEEIEAERAKALAKEAKAERIRQTQDDFVQAMYKNELSAQDILDSDLPAVGLGSKDWFMAQLNASVNGALDYNKTDGNLFTQLREMVMEPEGSPDAVAGFKITDPNEIYDFVGKGLNRTDADWLVSLYDEQNKPATDAEEAAQKGLNDRMTEFLKNMKGVVQGTGIGGLADPEKGEQFYRYSYDVRQKVEEFRKAGKDPNELFNPASKDYMGKPEIVQSYKRSMVDIINSGVSNMIINQPQRKPGQSPEDYLKEHGLN